MLETAKFEFKKAVTTDHMLPESEFAVADSFTLVDIRLPRPSTGPSAFNSRFLRALSRYGTGTTNDRRRKGL